MRSQIGHALDRRPHFDHLDDLALGLADDEDAAARNRPQQALLLEQRHRLADRRPRDPQRERQLALVEPDLALVRVDVGLDDRLLQRRVGLVAQARVRVDRLERQRDLRDGSRAGGHGFRDSLLAGGAGRCDGSPVVRRVDASPIGGRPATSYLIYQNGRQGAN